MSAKKVLIPCKGFTEGKSRLAMLLPAGEREKLCLRFLMNSIRLARALTDNNQISIVSNDLGVKSVGQRERLRLINDPGFGLNSALSFARDEISCQEREVSQLLILPTDLPCASVIDVRQLLESNSDVTIAPDLKGTGTNLLCMRGRSVAVFDFHFGEESFQNHCEEAQRRDLRLSVINSRGVGLDIDEPSDYVQWQSQKSSLPLLEDHHVAG